MHNFVDLFGFYLHFSIEYSIEKELFYTVFTKCIRVMTFTIQIAIQIRNTFTKITINSQIHQQIHYIYILF